MWVLTSNECIRLTGLTMAHRSTPNWPAYLPAWGLRPQETKSIKQSAPLSAEDLPTHLSHLPSRTHPPISLKALQPELNLFLQVYQVGVREYTDLSAQLSAWCPSTYLNHHPSRTHLLIPLEPLLLLLPSVMMGGERRSINPSAQSSAGIHLRWSLMTHQIPVHPMQPSCQLLIFSQTPITAKQRPPQHLILDFLMPWRKWKRGVVIITLLDRL